MNFSWFAWCIATLVLDTPLWGIISLVIALLTGTSFSKLISESQAGNLFCSFVLQSIALYPIFLVLFVLIRKFAKAKTSPFSMAIHSIIRGLTNPFRQTYLFLLIVTRKHTIQDDSPLRNFEDFLQILFPFAWYFVLAIFIIHGFLSIR